MVELPVEFSVIVDSLWMKVQYKYGIQGSTGKILFNVLMHTLLAIPGTARRLYRLCS